MTRVEVIRGDKLNRMVWVFWFNCDHRGPQLMLDEYREEARETTRKRKWDARKVYTRIGDTRRLAPGQKLKAEAVIVPMDVEVEAKEKLKVLIEEMQVKRSTR